MSAIPLRIQPEIKLATAKPKKPYPTFPLTPHVRGGWGKKYRGQQLYIKEQDPDEALANFNRLAKRIDEGEVIAGAKRLECATVYDVTNKYVSDRKEDRDAGRLSDGAWKTYEKAAHAQCDCFGDDTPYESLTPDDFTRLYRLWSKTLGAHALGRMVQASRTIWNHAEENDWIKRRPKFGSVFRKPVTERKQGVNITPDQAAVLIACAVGSQVEAMLLLMINGGFTAKDCAVLPRSAVDFNLNIIRFPRPKMKRRRPIDRVVVMWPETAEALRDVMQERPKDNLVFRTIHGNPWATHNSNQVVHEFAKIKDALGWEIGGCSWLRHLHRTISDELEKPNAAARLMGHRLAGMSEIYVDTIEHVRIQQITDHIRLRLWPCVAPKHPAPPETSPAQPSESPTTHKH